MGVSLYYWRILVSCNIHLTWEAQLMIKTHAFEIYTLKRVLVLSPSCSVRLVSGRLVIRKELCFQTLVPYVRFTIKVII